MSGLYLEKLGKHDVHAHIFRAYPLLLCLAQSHDGMDSVGPLHFFKGGEPSCPRKIIVVC